jgi:hypothetical protein
MRAAHSCLGLLAALVLSSLPAPAAAQPIGSEFQVNTYTTGNQRFSSVAADADGDFVVVWESAGQDGSSYGIVGQRYDTTGAAIGAEFRVNSYTTSNQLDPSVASDASGNFVVVWHSVPGQDGDGAGVFGQRYDSEGVPLGTEFLVNSFTTGQEFHPSVASDASGNFVVVWRNYSVGNGGIFGQRYDSEGVAQGGEFRVAAGNDTAYPSVASTANGNFVVVWVEYFSGGFGTRGQRYDSQGVPQGNQFVVSSDDLQYDPKVASDASGNFVVVVQSISFPNGTFEIFGNRFDSQGVPLGGFVVNSYTTGHQSGPSVASDASGNFLVVWASPGQDGSGDAVFGKRYDSEGTVQGEEFQINSFTTASQALPSAAVTDTNRFVVTWQSFGQDGNNNGIFGKRLNVGTGTITVVSPNTNVKWRIGALQRIQWTHNLGGDQTFRIEPDRNDDGNYEDLIAADAPADSATRGHFAWTVTGPASGMARMRVSWADDPGVSDSSDVTFQIRPVP